MHVFQQTPNVHIRQSLVVVKAFLTAFVVAALLGVTPTGTWGAFILIFVSTGISFGEIVFVAYDRLLRIAAWALGFVMLGLLAWMILASVQFAATVAVLSVVKFGLDAHHDNAP